MRKFLLSVALALLVTSPALAQKAEIEKANARWMELFNKGDFDGVGRIYTGDAQAFPPESSIVKGRAAIAQMWKGMAEQVRDPKLVTLEVKRLGPKAAREIGTFSLKTKSSDPKEIAGKYIVTWERVKGSWLIATDIWNAGK
jgi:uncharacterized protein (TIGR02246 family)